MIPFMESDRTLGGKLPLPKRLLKLIETGRWPRTHEEELHQNLRSLVAKERIRSFAPEQDRIYLFNPPFRSIAQRMSGVEGEFWSEWGALGEIAPELALDIGDFGIGADSAIVLDYRHESPPVIRLIWRKPEPNVWVRCANSFDEFADLLRLD
jgi:hypothetical protein